MGDREQRTPRQPAGPQAAGQVTQKELRDLATVLNRAMQGESVDLAAVCAGLSDALRGELDRLRVEERLPELVAAMGPEIRVHLAMVREAMEKRRRLRALATEAGELARWLLRDPWRLGIEETELPGVIAEMERFEQATTRVLGGGDVASPILAEMRVAFEGVTEDEQIVYQVAEAFPVRDVLVAAGVDRSTEVKWRKKWNG